MDELKARRSTDYQDLAKSWLAMPDNPTSLQADICDQLAWAIEHEKYAARSLHL